MTRVRTLSVSLVLATVLAGAVILLWHEQVFAVPVKLTTGIMEAWGWIGAPTDQAGATEGLQITSAEGFFHLNCDSAVGFCDTVDSKYPNVTVDADTGDISGWGWFGNDITTSGTPYSLGWVNFDPKPLTNPLYADPACVALGPANFYPAEPCYPAQLDIENKEEVSGWARIISIGLEGDRALGTTSMDNDWGWILLQGNNTADGDEYGVLYRNGSFEGWAWSGGGTLPDASYSNSVGLGWIDFSGSGGGSPTGPKGGFVATERGDVYVAGGISNPAGVLSPPQFNATYLITGSAGTGSVVNFSSELLGEGNFIDENSPVLTLPDADSEYRSELGRIDFDKLTTQIDGTKNIWGDEVMVVPSLAGMPAQVFVDGAVVFVDDGSGPGQSNTISDAITFLNGTALPSSGSNFDGAITIVVNGDLTINANLFYNNTTLLDLKNLASVAWIIRGDLTIGENVSNIVGSFFVVGDDFIGDGVSDGTITTLPTSASQLVAYGLLMGRTFDFQRTYEGLPGTDEPSELIYYDGRIIANTPPGLKDYASTLPIVD
ncbi:MAG: hypothetical protein ABIG66_02290 [Candidatus Kerfeldbacteria bacterium]